MYPVALAISSIELPDFDSFKPDRWIAVSISDFPAESYERDFSRRRERQMRWKFGTKIQFALLAIMTAWPSSTSNSKESNLAVSLFIKYTA